MDSCVDYSTRAVPIVKFVDALLNELGCSSIFDLTLMSFCMQGLPGVAESTFQKVKENLFLNWILFQNSQLIHIEFGSSLIKFLSLLG